MNTEFTLKIPVFSLNTEKHGQEKTTYSDTFHARYVRPLLNLGGAKINFKIF